MSETREVIAVESHSEKRKAYLRLKSMVERTKAEGNFPDGFDSEKEIAEVRKEKYGSWRPWKGLWI